MAALRHWPAVLLAMFLTAAALPAAAVPLTFGISPASTDIGFAVEVLGLATAEGEFRRFSGSLILDFDHPEQSAVSVRIDSESAAMAWQMAESMVFGESYLDVEHFPEIRFASRLVTVTGAGKVRMEGMLTLRGISHWESFEAELIDRRRDGDSQGDRAVFAATGTVHRSDYLMDGGDNFIDDRVVFTIRSRLLVNPPTPVPVP